MTIVLKEMKNIITSTGNKNWDKIHDTIINEIYEKVSNADAGADGMLIVDKNQNRTNQI